MRAPRLKPRLRRDTLLPKHITHHHGAFFWQRAPWTMLSDTVEPADLEAIAREVRAIRAAQAALRHPRVTSTNRRNP